jgi:hypothetical protein
MCVACARAYVPLGRRFALCSALVRSLSLPRLQVRAWGPSRSAIARASRLFNVNDVFPTTPSLNSILHSPTPAPTRRSTETAARAKALATRPGPSHPNRTSPSSSAAGQRRAPCYPSAVASRVPKLLGRRLGTTAHFRQ